LKDVLEDGDFDVENVEIKMTVAEIDWSDKPNKIAESNLWMSGQISSG